MDNNINFQEGRNGLIEFFNTEYEGFDQKLLSHFLNSFNELLSYKEEDSTTKPRLIFTNNIDAVLKAIPKSYKLQVFVDDDTSMFNSRLKPLVAIAKKDWCIYIEHKDNTFVYGICKTFSSLKEKSLITLISENKSLKDKADKISCIVTRSVSNFEMSIYSISGNKISVNTSLNPSQPVDNDLTIQEFSKLCFSKLRTTKKKLEELQILFSNIFTKVIDDLNGAMCVIVDKDYKDNGFFEDGIWLETPISLSKLFTQSKSYSEEKLQAITSLFINMLNFDGITIVDTTGRILAYNVFVESNMKRAKNVIGGARKRAAYSIINSRRKHICGVYFQSHEGEIFFKSLIKPKVAKPKDKTQPLEKPSVEETDTQANKEHTPLDAQNAVTDKDNIKN